MGILKYYDLSPSAASEATSGEDVVPTPTSKLSTKKNLILKEAEISSEKVQIGKIPHLKKEIAPTTSSSIDRLKPPTLPPKEVSSPSKEKQQDISAPPAPLPTETEKEHAFLSQREADIEQREQHLETSLQHQKQEAEKDISDYKIKQFETIDKEKKALLETAYNEGLEKGRAEATKDLGKKSQDLLRTIAEVSSTTERIMKKSKAEVLKLSLKVAEQIVRHEISLNQGICLNIVSEAIGKITDKEQVIIRVNRSDLEFLKINQDRITAQMGDIKNLLIQDDSRVDPGGCIIETNLGYIDAMISTKLESIRLAIMDVYEEEQKTENTSGTTEKVTQESDPISAPEGDNSIENNAYDNNNSITPQIERPADETPLDGMETTPNTAEIDETNADKEEKEEEDNWGEIFEDDKDEWDDDL